MKKSLVALATLAATSAFAQFSIDGNMDVAYGRVNYKGNTVTGIINNGANTSQINFRGTENLGGGLKASFRVETDWNTVSNNGNTGTKNADGTVAAGSTFGNGEIRAGIAGGFGAIDAGAVNNAQLTAFLTGQPFGTAIGSAFRGVYVNDAASAVNASVVRFDNSVRYTTPAMSGFSATVLQVVKNSKASSSNFSTTFGGYDYKGVSEYSLNYNQGPINATYAVTKQDANGISASAYTANSGSGIAANTVTADTSGTSTLKTLGGNYTLGALTLYALNQNATNSANTLDRSVTTFSAKYAMGANDFMVQTGSAKNDLTGKKSNVLGAGYTYNLSKLSNIYVRYESIKDDAGIIPAASTIDGTSSTTRTRTAIGYKVGF